MLAEVETLLQRSPDSAVLWRLRGHLLQLSTGDSRTLASARESYERAIALDPSSANAHLSLAEFIDGVEDDPAAAEAHFRNALLRGAGTDAKLGLARVLAQLGRTTEALQELSSPQLAANEDAAELRDEIHAGLYQE